MPRSHRHGCFDQRAEGRLGPDRKPAANRTQTFLHAYQAQALSMFLANIESHSVIRNPQKNPRRSTRKVHFDVMGGTVFRDIVQGLLHGAEQV